MKAVATECAVPVACAEGAGCAEVAEERAVEEAGRVAGGAGIVCGGIGENNAVFAAYAGDADAAKRSTGVVSGLRQGPLRHLAVHLNLTGT